MRNLGISESQMVQMGSEADRLCFFGLSRRCGFDSGLLRNSFCESCLEVIRCFYLLTDCDGDPSERLQRAAVVFLRITSNQRSHDERCDFAES